MCGRYTNTVGPEELNETIGKHFGVKITERTSGDPYNIAPTNEVLAIVSKDGKPEVRMLRWGIVPPWAKDTKGGYKMINAALETITERAKYRPLIATAEHRGLQFADGYIEWLKSGEHKGKPIRQPYYFQLEDGKPFAFPCLWTTNRHVREEPIESCALITCSSETNQLVRAIHPRMPVIFETEAEQDAWLNPGIDMQDAIELCQLLPASHMTVRPVNRAIGKVGGDVRGAELLESPPASAQT